ncbi:MAG: hypothetical protein WC150_03720 [Bacteroidia bacterium]
MIKQLNSPFFKFLLACILVNLVCWWVNPYNAVPTAKQQSRNIYPKRAWPEYISAAKDPGKKLVVIIGNSQSYGEVDENPEHIYPSYLRSKLIQKDVVLENWSVRGIRTSDIELLSAKALQKGADIIVFALDMSNFDVPENITLDYPNTDINLVLANAEVRKLMQHSLLAKSYGIEDVLRKTLSKYVPLVRLRSPLYKSLTSVVNKNDEILVFGNPVSREYNPQINDFKLMRDRLMNKKVSKNFEMKITKAHLRSYLHTATLFEYYLAQRVKGCHTKILFVWQPLNVNAIKPEERKLIDRFRNDMEKLNAKLGFKQNNMLEVIPESGMSTISHFNIDGHKMFADSLYNYLSNEL